MHPNHHIALLWFKAFNEHDLIALLELYDEEAEHYSPKLKLRQPQTNGLIKGKPALHDWWKDAFCRLPDLTYEIIHIMADDSCIFMEYLRRTKGEEDLRVAEVLHIRNGKIIASRVYHS